MNYKICIALVITFFVGIKYIEGCSCMGKKSIEESFAYSDLIIYGEVVNLKIVSFEETMDPDLLESSRRNFDEIGLKRLESRFIVEVEVKIINQYVGNVTTETATIFTSKSGASCGFGRFEMGKEFIIYGTKSSGVFYSFFRSSLGRNVKLERENTFWTNQCSRTTSLDIDELKVLNTICDFTN